MKKEEQIVCRILNVLPSTSVELNTFFRIFRVKLSTSVPTACITCSAEPELVLNPDFIEQHCRTDEHLLMLVMHELYHIILGHTRLFPHPTPSLNIIFDAVINAMLCHMFPEEAFTSFFTSFYPSNEMPYALLRPIGEDTPDEAKQALQLLYNHNNAVTYYDIYQALLSIAIPCSPVMLLGSHDSGEVASPLLNGIIHELTRNWPSANNGDDTCLFGDGEQLKTHHFHPTPLSLPLHRGIAQLVRWAHYAGYNLPDKQRIPYPITISSFIPNAKDKRHWARTIVQGASLMYQSSAPINYPSHNARKSAFVYIDVSGSVKKLIPQILSAIRPYVIRKQCITYTFSTEVAPLPPAMLKRSTFSSTGGTDINCVFKHLSELSRKQCPSSIILITDGETPQLNPRYIQWIQQRHIRVYCGLIGKSVDTYALQPVVRRFIRITCPQQ